MQQKLKILLSPHTIDTKVVCDPTEKPLFIKSFAVSGDCNNAFLECSCILSDGKKYIISPESISGEIAFIIDNLEHL